MRLPEPLASCIWTITARNHLGWPTERRNRLTGRHQHKHYFEDGGWKNGRLPALVDGLAVLTSSTRGGRDGSR